MNRKNAGYIILAASLILFGLLAAMNALFKWELSMWTWICYLFVPLAAVSLIVSYGPHIWNTYPLVFSLTQLVGEAVLDIWLYKKYEFYKDEYHESVRQLIIIHFAMAIVTLGMWLIMRTVKKVKQNPTERYKIDE